MMDMHHGGHSAETSNAKGADAQTPEHHHGHDMNAHHMDMKDMPMDHEMQHHMNHEMHQSMDPEMHQNMEHGMQGMQHHQMEKPDPEMNAAHNMSDHKSGTPLYISVALSVCHCGAGCVLGDIVGEWIVYATDVQINGRSLWPEMLIGSKPPLEICS
jgi:hypothetical protein